MNITLVSHDDSSRQAFIRGLLKGLASPVMLFAANKAVLRPVELPPLPQVQPIRLPESLTSRTDLQRIGADFWSAVRRYEQEGPQHSAVDDQRRQRGR